MPTVGTENGAMTVAARDSRPLNHSLARRLPVPRAIAATSFG